MKRYFSLLLLLGSFPSFAQLNKGKLITRNNYFESNITCTKTEFITKATVDGEECDFILDTGAPVFISKEMQKKHHFKSILKTKTKDAGGENVKTELVLIDTIRYGPFIFTDIPALVIDMDNSPIGCLHFSGNLGSNALRFLYVQFDVKAGKMRFADDKKLLPKSLPASHPMHVNFQSDVYLSVKLNDSITDTIHYDSGDGALYNMSNTCMNKCIAAYPAQVARTGYGILHMGIGGPGEEFPQYLFKPSSIQFGDGKVADGVVAVAGNDRSRMGRDLLNYGILQLNYPDSTYAFEGYPSPELKPHSDFGFRPIVDDKDVIVGCVWKGSQAEQMGLQNGDHITKIDEIDFTKMEKCDVVTMARAVMDSDKPSMTITYIRKKQAPKTITLEKKTL